MCSKKDSSFRSIVQRDIPLGPRGKKWGGDERNQKTLVVELKMNRKEWCLSEEGVGEK